MVDAVNVNSKTQSVEIPHDGVSSDKRTSSQILLDHVADIFKDVAQTHFTTSKHKAISEKALTPAGLSSGARFAIEVGDLSQDLDASTRAMPTHHFDDNTLEKSLEGVKESEQKIKEMVSKPGLTEDDEVAILHTFGQRLHTLQDFYAHSNYVERTLKENPNLRPQDIPLFNFTDIPAGRAKEVHTGFYYYENSFQNEAAEFWLSRSGIIDKLNGLNMKIPGTQYLPSDQYDKLSTFSDRLNYFTDQKYSVLHFDINKDDEKSDEGKVVDPVTNTKLFDYAKDLAERETRKQWSQFEDTVHKVHGQAEGDKILKQLKNVSFSNATLRSLRFSLDGLITWLS